MARRSGGSRRRRPRCRRRAPSRAAGSGRARAPRRGPPRRPRAPPRPRGAPPSRCCSSSSCSGVGLPFSFVRLRRSSTRGTSSAPALVGGEQRVERLAGALAGERGAPDVGLGAGCLEVDHARESRYASITVATPSSFALGQIQSARSSSSGFASSTAIPKPASSISSMSFSPSPNADDALERDAELLRDERDPRSLRDRGVAELEQVGERGRQEEAIAERCARAPRASAGISAGSATATSFVGGCCQPRGEVADLLDREVLEVGVHAGVLGVLGDVEAVVDVTVRRVPERRSAARSPRARSRAGSARGARTCRSRGRRPRRPGSRRRGR